MTSRAVSIGVYSAPEASCLLSVPGQKARRWLVGYSYRHGGELHRQPPLWHLQFPRRETGISLGFRDLMQLRVVLRLLTLGFSMQFVRGALSEAESILGREHPFVDSRFRTDGREIFLEVAERVGEPKLIQLRNRQWVMRQILEPSFIDVDIEQHEMRRWWPLGKDKKIVLDPERRFGRPISSKSGVPALTLCEAFDRDQSVEAVSRWYSVSEGEVRDALEMRPRLMH